jgi:uncharacterized cupin superfamily protein
VKSRGPIVNADAVTAVTIRHGDRFAAAVQRIGSALGMARIGCSLVRVPAGKRACPFHVHHGVDEPFYVLEGRGTLRWGATEYAIRAGDFISCPATTAAHQIVNDSDAELAFLGISTIAPTDVADYPNSDKAGFDVGDGVDAPPRMSCFRAGRACDCWDGES